MTAANGTRPAPLDAMEQTRRWAHTMAAVLASMGTDELEATAEVLAATSGGRVMAALVTQEALGVDEVAP